MSSSFLNFVVVHNDSIIIIIMAFIAQNNKQFSRRVKPVYEGDKGDAGGLSGELLHAGVGLLVLLMIQALNLYKPQGMTPYGWRKQHEQRKV
jgi:hypothetical protein